MSKSLQLTGKNLSSIELIPKKPQWTLINDYKLLEIERQKQLDKVANKEKRSIFRSQLDEQVQVRQQQRLKSNEKQYLQFEEFMKNNQIMKEKEENEKRQKFLKYKEVQQQNKRLINENNDIKAKNKAYFEEKFLLSGREEQEQKQKQKSQKIKKDILDTLQKQLKSKEQQREKEKLKREEEGSSYVRYELGCKYPPRKKRFHSQYQNVYNQYSQIFREKQMKEKDIEQKYIYEAGQKKIEEEIKKRAQFQVQKRQKKLKTKQMLDNQVRDNQKYHSEEKIENPESNNFVQYMQKGRIPRYDKKKYFEDLKRQVEQQKQKKNQLSFMNQDEYRMNLDQLNKVINGSYLNNRYLDRSVNAIGQNRSLGEIKLKNDDLGVVQKNIDQIRDQKN